MEKKEENLIREEIRKRISEVSISDLTDDALTELIEKELKETLKGMGFDASNQTKVKRHMRDYETASELWANTVSAVTCGGEELDAFKSLMPNTTNAVLSILGGV